MLSKLERNVAAARAGNAGDVRLVEGNAEKVPLPDASVDVVTSNGVLNLVPDKRGAFAEIFRVLRPGGRLQIADIALGRPVSDACRSDPQLWAECVVGATLEDGYLALLEGAGFERIEVLGHLDYFSASVSSATRSIAQSFGAVSLVLRAALPGSGPLPPALPWPPPRASAEPSGLPTAKPPTPDAVLDAHGQVCGMMEPTLKAHMDRLAPGDVLEVLTDDPSARLGLPAWSRLAGHTLLAALEEDAGRTRFYLRRD
jgi:TusA-related sulfurtransferase